MKNLLILLSVSLIIGCNQNRVLIDEIIIKGTKESPILFFEGKLFNGTSYDIFRDGQLKFEGEYSDGLRHGKFKKLNSNGQLLEEANYQNGLLHGTYSIYLENFPHTKILEKEYHEGMLQGFYHSWYGGGSRKYFLNFSKGLLDGKQEYFDRSFNLRLQLNVTNNKIKYFKSYYDNGYKKSEFYGDIYSVTDSIASIVFPNIPKKVRIEGIREDIEKYNMPLYSRVKRWHKNGQIHLIYNLKTALPFGSEFEDYHMEWYNNGQLKHSPYVDSLLSDTSTISYFIKKTFHRNGQIAIKEICDYTFMVINEKYYDSLGIQLEGKLYYDTSTVFDDIWIYTRPNELDFLFPNYNFDNNPDELNIEHFIPNEYDQLPQIVK